MDILSIFDDIRIQEQCKIWALFFRQVFKFLKVFFEGLLISIPKLINLIYHIIRRDLLLLINKLSNLPHLSSSNSPKLLLLQQVNQLLLLMIQPQVFQIELNLIPNLWYVIYCFIYDRVNSWFNGICGDNFIANL